MHGVTCGRSHPYSSKKLETKKQPKCPTRNVFFFNAKFGKHVYLIEERSPVIPTSTGPALFFLFFALFCARIGSEGGESNSIIVIIMTEPRIITRVVN